MVVAPQENNRPRVGHFDVHSDTPGVQYLNAMSDTTGTKNNNGVTVSKDGVSPSKEEMNTLKQQVHAEYLKEEGLANHGLSDGFQSYPDLQIVTPAEAARLIEYADKQHRAQPSADLKIDLTAVQLGCIIGDAATAETLTRFFFTKTGRAATELKLRRCAAYGHCIKFHLDTSLYTMQVPLNSDQEYQGARLVFASEEGLKFPARPRGSCTIHDNTVVHGVTTMQAGVRYGLFFLCDADQN
jgi:hypothetical protein